MRIQHNIMAMNAYRNYNANTSALSKNLEKLSSGYKINRAGDDAAGLAISEKMRAQITGLEAAQKNVKDGISLVKTAEGAMQEIQDMLNRMDYLATQSANGTYQDEVDRENLNKEMEALKTEIDRIADSANFNGIKLLDGSLDPNAIKGAVDAVDASTGNFEIPEEGFELGTDTVVHNKLNGNSGTEFSVDLHNFNFDAKTAGDKVTVTLGEGTSATKIELEVLDGSTKLGSNLTGDDIAKAITDGTNTDFKVTIGGKEYKAGNDITIGGQDFTMAKGTTAGRVTFTQKAAPKSETEEVNGSMKVNVSGNNLATKGTYEIDVNALFGDLTDGDVITIGGQTLAFDKTTAHDTAAKLATALSGLTYGDFDAEVKDNTTLVLTAKTAGEIDAPAATYASQKTAAVGTATVTGAAETLATTSGTLTGSVANNTGTLSINGEEVIGAGDFDGSAAVNGTTADGMYTYSVTAAGAVTITAAAGSGADANGDVTVSVNGGADQTLAFAGGVGATKQTYEVDISDWDGVSEIKVGNNTVEDGKALGSTGYNASIVENDDGTKTLKLEAATAGAAGGAGPAALTGNATYTATGAAEDITVTETLKGADASTSNNTGSNGDWNVSTTDINNVTSGGLTRLASTYFDLTEDMATEGSSIRIGDDVYTFTADKTKLADTSAKYVDISSGDLATIAKNLTDKAATNAVYTVGHDGSRITVTETVAHANFDGTTYPPDKWDLSTKEGIEKSLGFTIAGKEAVAGTAGKALNLQIGDSSDDFNQMKIEIGDMHVSAMGTFDEDGKLTTSINDIDILTSDNAQAAVDVIKNAINYVSGVRGDLGAYQNRLEHTANNLSVMAENIQDAESTIRDTDVAEEMMSYVKNNILVQSAQAMLAQANQVPQGVLQLLG